MKTIEPSYCINNYYFNKIIVICSVLLLLLILNLFNKRSATTLNYSLELDAPKNYCDKTKVFCTDDTECLDKCFPYISVEWLCDLNYCTPKPINSECNINNGGIWVFNYETHNFFCHCHYPEFFRGTGCETRNPFNCRNGTIKQFDATKNVPGVNFCECNPGYSKVIIKIPGQSREIATCISNKVRFFFSSDV